MVGVLCRLQDFPTVISPNSRDLSLMNDHSMVDGSRRVRGEIMFWLQSCLRCHGDLSENEDKYGGFIYCMQCGHYLTESEEANLKVAAAHDETPNRRTDQIPGEKSAITAAVHIKLPPSIAA